MATKDILISEYEELILPTDRFKDSDINPILLGLYGEVGSVMSTVKKLKREEESYPGYLINVEEEIGDTIWYLTALCRRLGINLSDLFSKTVVNSKFNTQMSTSDSTTHPISKTYGIKNVATLESLLLELGRKSANLLCLSNTQENAEELLLDFTLTVIETIQVSGTSSSRILNSNMKKTLGRFMKPELESLPTFDSHFPKEEQLPNDFEIDIYQRSNGRSYLRWNGVFIGDPLSDNISDPDGYRFHDVFHFANAAILHWSPTFRALIKHKRKSDSSIDEAQDSGRAIVIEEGLSAYIFSYAKQLNFFDKQTSVSFDLLKTIQNFTHGYEVDQCPLNLWETAIIKGYDVFRKVRENGGGTIIGNRQTRSIDYKPLRIS